MSGFYKEFKEKKQRQEREAQAREQYGAEENRPIIINDRANTSLRFFRHVSGVFGIFFRIIFYIAVTLLSSVGLTALINQPIREQLIQLFLP